MSSAPFPQPSCCRALQCRARVLLVFSYYTPSFPNARSFFPDCQRYCEDGVVSTAASTSTCQISVLLARDQGPSPISIDECHQTCSTSVRSARHQDDWAFRHLDAAAQRDCRAIFSSTEVRPVFPDSIWFLQVLGGLSHFHIASSAFDGSPERDRSPHRIFGYTVAGYGIGKETAPHSFPGDWGRLPVIRDDSYGLPGLKSVAGILQRQSSFPTNSRT